MNGQTEDSNRTQNKEPGIPAEGQKHSLSLTWITCLRVGISGFLLYLAVSYWQPLVGGVWRILTAAAPLFFGFVIAYVVNILMSFYEKFYFRKHPESRWAAKSRRAVCLTGAILTVIGAVGIVTATIVPQLADAITVITKKLPNVLKNLAQDEKLMEILPENIRTAIHDLDYTALLAGITNFLSKGASTTVSTTAFTQTITSTLSSLSSKLMTFFMGFIFSIYILTGKERLKSQLKRLSKVYFSTGWMSHISPILSVANDCFHNYIVGQVTEAMIIGVLCAVGMTIFHLPYAAMIGTVIGFTALIPVLGAYMGGIVGALMCFSDSPAKAVEFVIFLVILQQLEDNLIYPRVVGTSLGLPGIWVLAAVTVGGGIGGIFGMLFAVPVAATIYTLIKNDVHDRESKARPRLTAADVVQKLK